MSDEIDALLIARLRRRDEAAWRTVTRKLSPTFKGLALRRGWHPDDADEAIQQTWVNMAASIRGFKGNNQGAFLVWAERILRNCYLGQIEDRWRRGDLPPEIEAPARDLDAQIDARSRLARVLDRLKRMKREVQDLLKRNVDGEESKAMSARERVQLLRARRKLRGEDDQ